jgi:hypothetical protein
MQENRSEERTTQQSADSTLWTAETLRQSIPSGGPPAATKGEERLSVFWRLCGATLLSITALGGITLCQHFNSSLSDLRKDLSHVSENLSKDLGRVHETQADLLKKEEFSFRLKTVWDALKELQEDKASLWALKERAAVTEQRQRADEEERKELVREVQKLRELKAAQDQRKELLDELQRLRERLAVVEGRQVPPSPTKTATQPDE